MPITVSEQAHVFLYAIFGGAIIAFIYDLFRIKRKAIRTSTVIIYMEDFIYWVIVAAVMSGVIYYSNEGEIRGYIFIGTIAGAIIYILLFSRIIIGSSMFILKLLYKVFRAVWIAVSYPFRILFKIFAIPARFFLNISRKAVKRTKQAGRNRAARSAIWKKIFRNRRNKI